MAERQSSGATGVSFLERMYQRDENPLTARSRFRHRHLRYWGKAISIFAGVAIAFAVIVPWLEWFADIAAGIGLWYLLFHVWDKEPVQMRCNHCGKLIETNIPWICGFKNQCRNDAIDEFPFVHRCQHCGAEPKAYQCHHCGELIFLTEDELKQNYARCTRPFKERSDLDIPSLQHDLQKVGLELNIEQVDKKKAELTAKPNPRENMLRQRAEELDDIKYATYKADLTALRATQEAAAKRAMEANLSTEEKIQKKHDADFKGKAYCHKGLALAEELYKDDPHTLEQERLWWKNELENFSNK